MASELERIVGQLVATCQEVTGLQGELLARSRALQDAAAAAAAAARGSSRPDAAAAAALLNSAASSCARAANSLVQAQQVAVRWAATTASGGGGGAAGGSAPAQGSPGADPPGSPTGAEAASSAAEAFRGAAFRTGVGTAFFAQSDYAGRRAAYDVPAYPGEHVLDLHGTSGTVQLRDDAGMDHDLDAAAFAAVVRSTGWTGQPIRLFSCDTGRSANGFAQQLADELGVEVTAPTTPVWSVPGRRTPITADSTYRLILGRYQKVPVDPPNGRWQTFSPRELR